MSRMKCILAAVLFLLATALKFALPSAAGELREELHRVLEQDTDFRTAMTQLGVRFSGEEGLIHALGLREGGAPSTPEPTPMPTATSVPTPEPAARGSLPDYRPMTLPRLRAQFTAHVRKAPSREAVAAAAAALAETSAAVPEQAPAAVAVFLAAQSAFSDYAVPAGVSYAVPELGLGYACPVSGCTSSGFGYRVHPISGEVKFHYGTDFAAWEGTDIRCFADGTVSVAGEDDSFGKYLVVEHENGCRSLYAHCSELLAAAGAAVKCGDVIARVGSTGQVTGPHLHFELTRDGTYLNPEYYVNQMG